MAAFAASGWAASAAATFRFFAAFVRGRTATRPSAAVARAVVSRTHFLILVLFFDFVERFISHDVELF